MSTKYDLHLHSCLSPCGMDDLTPSTVVGMAKVMGLDCIAISDHNSTKHCAVAQQAGQHYGITVVPAMELNTAEEVHVLCLFADLDSALAFGEYVQSRIMPIDNVSSIYGNQLIYDIDDNCIGCEQQLLIVATSIAIFDVANLVKQYNGVAIPAHIDRQANGIIAVLGQIPDDCNFVTVEVSSNATKQFVDQIAQLGYNVIRNSDSHMLESIGKCNATLDVDITSAQQLVDYLSHKWN